MAEKAARQMQHNTPTWAGLESPLAQHVALQSQRCLDAYRANPLLVKEHANIERATAQGGYGRRQIYELVQNGADALIGTEGGRIEVLLTESALYCANEGDPIDLDGLDAILSSHVSMKRGTEIGRFGLGFKSVLGVTNRPEFYSRSGSFKFNADESAARIREIVPEAQALPILRLAAAIDPASARSEDPNLSKALSWATTVVKLPRTSIDASWLSEDIQRFPAEFLLFSPHVALLVLEDRPQGFRREIRLRKQHEHLRLIEGATSSGWRSFSTYHTPSADARKDAGELAGRDNLPIIWAVPHGRPMPGRFWAFFPTEYVTTLSGIINAPWKTNEDRQNLLTGPFNIELLRVVAELAVENLACLMNPKDPGWILDIMPARRDEFRNWADQELNDRFYELAANRPALPNQDGDLSAPSTLSLHPAGLPEQALEIWCSYEGRPKNWCHPSADTRTRRIRAERLLSTAGRNVSSIEDWLEALVEDGTPAASSAAVCAAAKVLEADPSRKWAIERARIVLTSDGTLVQPVPSKVFIPSGYASVGGELTYVHPDLAKDPGVLAALSILGVHTVDARRELEAHVAGGFYLWKDEDWDKLWILVELVGPSVAAEVLLALSNRHLIRVRTASGKYRQLSATLLPDDIVSEGSTRDSDVVIDTTFHSGVLRVLDSLGAVSKPTRDHGTTREDWFFRYRNEAISDYLTHVPGRSSRPREDYLQFDHETFVGPLEPIFHLSEEGRARFTEEALTHEDTEWTLSHQSRRDAYPVQSYISPSLWVIRNEGYLETSLGYHRVAECVGPSLAVWDRVLPIARCTNPVASRLGLPDSLEKLSDEHWNRALAFVSNLSDIDLLGRFYAVAAPIVSAAPDYLRCRLGDEYASVARTSITVATAGREFDVLVSQRIPSLLVGSQSDAETLISLWQLKPAHAIVRTELYYVASGSATLVADIFPAIRYRLRPEDRDTAAVQCSALGLVTLTEAGKVSEQKTLHIEGKTVYWQEELGYAGLLERLSVALELGLSADDRRAVVEHRADLQRRERISSIRVQPSLADRFLGAVGASQIRRRLPAGLIEAVELTHGSLSDTRIAELALVVYGVDLLHAFRTELEESGLQPPAQWAGSRAAAAFVKDLGFPREFAGFEQARRDPVLDVDGPPSLPPLHDFQRRIADNMKALLGSRSGTRGLLSLPTGAGKTRVAVQALIEAIKEGFPGPLLWVAQTDELCEQAVQTWSYVWRTLGPQRKLCINRLWAANEAEQGSGTQVVVATISKLQGCFTDAAYQWLSQATCVIIDEAHGSTTPAFTALLEWQGIGRGRSRCPLIGLTATPFRGRSEEETLRLVKRYGEKRLDAGALGQDPYATLQRMGVISRVKHVLLDGVPIELTDEELNQLRQTSKLPASAEDRLGLNTSRNRVLLGSIKQLPRDWTALLFATSVDHAQTMAALLSLEGISAAPISAATEPAIRRHYIDEFRAGKLRVLTNYDVLAQGFDAPAVRAVYVARPTFSPNRYQQMIGRGLRGPKNGGKPECLIVNVADNILQYGDELAFRQFEYLWNN
ncbi:MAG: DEAD/DEAH box helicase family protein [Bryobacteraceae bacterium]